MCLAGQLPRPGWAASGRGRSRVGRGSREGAGPVLGGGRSDPVTFGLLTGPYQIPPPGRRAICLEPVFLHEGQIFLNFLPRICRFLGHSAATLCGMVIRSDLRPARYANVRLLVCPRERRIGGGCTGSGSDLVGLRLKPVLSATSDRSSVASWPQGNFFRLRLLTSPGIRVLCPVSDRTTPRRATWLYRAIVPETRPRLFEEGR
jgi:hypothetical protein